MRDLITRAEKLEFLQGLELIGTINFNDTAKFWIQKYPDLYNAMNVLPFSFSANGGNFTFEIVGNIVTERLFFYIRDMEGNTIQSFQPLVEYPYNLLLASNFIGKAMYFFENKLYFEE